MDRKQCKHCWLFAYFPLWANGAYSPLSPAWFWRSQKPVEAISGNFSMFSLTKQHIRIVENLPVFLEGTTWKASVSDRNPACIFSSLGSTGQQFKFFGSCWERVVSLSIPPLRQTPADDPKPSEWGPSGPTKEKWHKHVCSCFLAHGRICLKWHQVKTEFVFPY